MKFVVPHSAFNQSWKNASNEKHQSNPMRIHFALAVSSLQHLLLGPVLICRTSCVLVCCIHKRLANQQLYRPKWALLPRRFSLVRWVMEAFLEIKTEIEQTKLAYLIISCMSHKVVYNGNRYILGYKLLITSLIRHIFVMLNW